MSSSSCDRDAGEVGDALLPLVMRELRSQAATVGGLGRLGPVLDVLALGDFLGGELTLDVPHAVHHELTPEVVHVRPNVDRSGERLTRERVLGIRVDTPRRGRLRVLDDVDQVVTQVADTHVVSSATGVERLLRTELSCRTLPDTRRPSCRRPADARRQARRHRGSSAWTGLWQSTTCSGIFASAMTPGSMPQPVTGWTRPSRAARRSCRRDRRRTLTGVAVDRALVGVGQAVTAIVDFLRELLGLEMVVHLAAVDRPLGDAAGLTIRHRLGVASRGHALGVLGDLNGVTHAHIVVVRRPLRALVSSPGWQSLV